MLTSDETSLILAALVLGAATHVVLAPERYLRRRREGSFDALLREVGGDRAVAERLVVAEIERGATSRASGARSALARLRRDRVR